MDVKEIINSLELINKIAPNYVRGRNRGLTDEEIEAKTDKVINKAIEALDRQIPKKPKSILKGVDGTIIGKCPRCNMVVTDSFYCSFCGQSLNWN